MLIELSRGWQMRHPLNIRQYELRKSFTTRIKRDPPPPLDMFAVEPCAAESASTSMLYFDTHAKLPTAIRYLVEALNCISSYFDAILGSNTVPTTPDSEWGHKNQNFTAWVATLSETAMQNGESS
jgi:hypothetical protein